MRVVITLVISCVFLANLAGQDIHYSQFFNSPLNLSPALTGVYNGDVRAHANFRQQWAGVPVDYLSGDLGVDIRHPSKNRNLAYGLLLNYDRAGDLDLGWTGATLLGSYSIKAGENIKVTPGVSVSYLSRSFSQGNATSGNQWNGKGVGPGESVELIQSDNISYLDIGAGLNLRRQTSYRQHLDLGVSLFHINAPTEKFFTQEAYTSTRPLKFNAYGMLNHPLSNKLDVIANLLYSKQEAYQEIVLNAQAKIFLSKAANKALFLGAGYRVGDAWYPMIAFQLGQFYGSFSYDANISDWDVASDGRGGPELSVRYIWAKVRDIDYKPCLIF